MTIEGLLIGAAIGAVLHCVIARQARIWYEAIGSSQSSEFDRADTWNALGVGAVVVVLAVLCVLLIIGKAS